MLVILSERSETKDLCTDLSRFFVGLRLLRMTVF